MNRSAGDAYRNEYPEPGNARVEHQGQIAKPPGIHNRVSALLSECLDTLEELDSAESHRQHISAIINGELVKSSSGEEMRQARSESRPDPQVSMQTLEGLVGRIKAHAIQLKERLADDV